jgi:hypothetical protein
MKKDNTMKKRKKGNGEQPEKQDDIRNTNSLHNEITANQISCSNSFVTSFERINYLFLPGTVYKA